MVRPLAASLQVLDQTSLTMALDLAVSTWSGFILVGGLGNLHGELLSVHKISQLILAFRSKEAVTPDSSYATISFTTSPDTSVSRKSRPL